MGKTICTVPPLPGGCDHMLVPDNALSWPEVAARLAAARNYWLCTTTPSGAPHAAPVWGVVTGGTRTSIRRAYKARNLAADPRIVVHLESGEDVVIVHGTARDLGTRAQAWTWSRPRRPNTPARETGSTCRMPTPISTWPMPSGHGRR
jgi:hypothetical protein